jgi:hypothetical protein
MTVLGRPAGIKSVQRGLNSMGTGTGTINVSISSVDMSKSFVTVSQRINTAAVDRLMATVRLTSSTNLEINRDDNYSTTFYAWEVVEFE